MLIEDIERKLVNCKLPTYRQAYSDRTAWLCATLSELAYLKFNKPPAVLNLVNDVLNQFDKNTTQAHSEKRKTDLLQRLLSSYDYSAEENEKKLKALLNELSLELVETFNQSGTQAFLAANESNIFLAFRGTEVESPADIKADLDARMSGGIHSGFKKAFDYVHEQIQAAINAEKHKGKALIICGHSLGGALATIAAKELTHYAGGISSCYTYGSPRVGNPNWVSKIKPPVYRVVNAVDVVTMLPPGKVAISALSTIVGFIPWIGSPLAQQLRANMDNYLHAGDMRYLISCKPGQYENVQLLPQVSLFWRIQAYWKQSGPNFKEPLIDHSISIYRKKLSIIAQQKNPLLKPDLNH